MPALRQETPFSRAAIKPLPKEVLRQSYLNGDHFRGVQNLVHGWLSLPWDPSELAEELKNQGFTEVDLEKFKEPYSGLDLGFAFTKRNGKEYFDWQTREEDTQVLVDAVECAEKWYIDYQKIKETLSPPKAQALKNYLILQLKEIARKSRLFQALDNDSIPRNKAHLRVTPFEHTFEVIEGLIIEDVSYPFFCLLMIQGLFHDVGKTITAYKDEEQHHCVISAEVLDSIILRLTEKSGTASFVTQEPYRSMMYTVITLHDTLGTLLQSGVFEPGDIEILIDLNLEPLKKVYGNTQLYQMCKVQTMQLLAALCSADSLSVKGYEHYAGLITALSLKIYDSQTKDSNFKHINPGLLQFLTKRAYDNLMPTLVGQSIVQANSSKLEAWNQQNVDKTLRLLRGESLLLWLTRYHQEVEEGRRK